MNRWRALAIPALLWLLSGCTALPSPTPAGQALPFETIERSDYSPYYQQHPAEPQRLLLIASAQDAARLAGWLDPQAEAQLAHIDYNSCFVLALFRGGTFGSSGYDAVIQRVVRQDDRLVVYARYWAPSPHYLYAASQTEPHHVIKVERDGKPLRETGLVLETQVVTPTPPPEAR